MKNFTKKTILATTVLATIVLTVVINVSTTNAVGTTWYACSGGGNWSASVWTSILADEVGCTGATGHPVAGDTAVLNSSSGNITVNVSSAASFLDETGYTGTLALGSQVLTLTTGENIGGAMTASTGSIQNGGGTITLLSTATGSFPTIILSSGATTLTAGAYSWPGKLTIQSSGITTFTNGGSAWTNTGLVSVSTNNIVLNGDPLICNGGLTVSKSTSGTTNITLGGGTWSGANNLANNLTLAGNITVSGTVNYGTGTLTYSSGAITTTGSALAIFSSATLNTNGMTWGTVQTTAVSPTITLTSDLTSTGLSLLSNGSVTFSGAYNIHTGTFTVTKLNNPQTHTFVAGQTLYVSSAMAIQPGTTLTIQSDTPSSPTYIVYTGTVANEEIVGTTFTDIQATAPSLGSLGANLANYYGGTLTRTSGIINVDATNLGGGGSTGFMIGIGN